MTLRTASLIVSLLVAGFAAMTPAAATAKPLEAVASFTILADMVREVGGDRVHVTSLVGRDGDPHAYEPTPDDARALKAADIVFVNGLGLEGWMDRLIKASGFQGKPVIASTGVHAQSMQEDGRTVTDPHAWNSPINGVAYVRTIQGALTAADPGGAQTYQSRADSYVKVLQALDAYAKQNFDPIPQAQRKVLTTHDAFGYFGRRYGITFLSPLGLSTESEASAAQIAKLVRQIKAEHVRSYFFENSNDPRLVEQIAAATGAQPGGKLYVEALSPEDGPAATYVAMLHYDITELAAAMKE